jgi:hypothetical protein
MGVLAFLTAHGAVIWGIWRRREGLRHLTGPIGSAHALAGALVLAKFMHGLVDHYWSRGAIMVAWSSVGIALAARRLMLPEARVPPRRNLRNPRTMRRLEGVLETAR